MKSEYSAGDFLFNETIGTPFIHDGDKTADGLGVVIGFTYSKGEKVLCRTSGKGNFQTSANVRRATEEEIEWLLNRIANAKDIPFYGHLS